MVEPKQTDMEEEEINLTLDHTITQKTILVTPNWYESDDTYRPFVCDVYGSISSYTSPPDTQETHQNELPDHQTSH